MLSEGHTKTCILRGVVMCMQRATNHKQWLALQLIRKALRIIIFYSITRIGLCHLMPTSCYKAGSMSLSWTKFCASPCSHSKDCVWSHVGNF
uniref:Uncharacterized protein n=1 Tax=Pararge aegeria TaxID=116150 RepID=S4PCI8_9NEOP